MTVREQFERVLLAEITELNGDITEEGLNMEIARELLDDRIEQLTFNNRDNLVAETLDSVKDTEQVEVNGAFVYKLDEKGNFIFEKYNTIADAVRKAIKMINADIICNGEVITYDELDSNTAYYIDDRINKVVMVDI